MFWSIGSLPELEHVTEDDRKTILRSVGSRRATWDMVFKAVLLGLTVCILVAVGARWPWAILAWPLTAVLGYQFQIIRLRGQLLIYLERVARERRLPMCLKCGYNLEGLASERCPECGWMVQPAAAEDAGNPRRPD